MAEPEDLPLEVTLVDGSRWVIYYRLSNSSFGAAIPWLARDIAEGGLRPAEDLDGVQSRHAQINMTHVVSVREVDLGE